jgi:hypothetical protein
MQHKLFGIRLSFVPREIAIGSVWLAGWLTCASLQAEPISGAQVHFKRTQLETKFRSEGVAIGDYNHDGQLDIAIGIWRLEQTANGWTPHEIDASFSQTHSLCMADINGDGLPDLITGKRWWAHGQTGDVQPNSPAVVFWYELRREGGKPVWTAHEVDHDSGVGTQFEVADVNRDGLLDIVTSNKKGVFYFQQTRSVAPAAQN